MTTADDVKQLQKLADCGGMEMEFLELAQDAMRYRWLRDRGAVGGMRGIFSLMPGEWSEAIDAAMSGDAA